MESFLANELLLELSRIMKAVYNGDISFQEGLEQNRNALIKYNDALNIG
jgi:hypothetical protein